jgi:hypothetical protein
VICNSISHIQNSPLTRKDQLVLGSSLSSKHIKKAVIGFFGLPNDSKTWWVSISCFGQSGKWEKEKIFWTRDMVKRTGEEIRVPASYSRRPGF